MGIFVTFLFLKMLVFMYLQAADVFVTIWKVLECICGSPIIAVIISNLKCVYKFCLNILRKEEEEKGGNAVIGLSRRLVKDLDERLAEIDRKGILDERDEK